MAARPGAVLERETLPSWDWRLQILPARLLRVHAHGAVQTALERQRTPHCDGPDRAAAAWTRRCRLRAPRPTLLLPWRQRFRISAALLSIIRPRRSSEVSRSGRARCGAGLPRLPLTTLWLEDEFHKVTALPYEPARLIALERLRTWADPVRELLRRRRERRGVSTGRAIRSGRRGASHPRQSAAALRVGTGRQEPQAAVVAIQPALAGGDGVRRAGHGGHLHLAAERRR